MKKKSKAPWRAATDIFVTGVTLEQRPVSAKTLKRIEKSMKKFFGKGRRAL